jgi:Putative peptidoglycan binding domain
MTHVQSHICSLVHSYAGVSLDHDRKALGELVARGVDDPERVVGIKTNCATTALGFLALLGVDHRLLREPYRIGMAMAWLVEIGNALGIIHEWHGDRSVLHPGILMHYCLPESTNDHVEWLLTEPDAMGVAYHGGGGRAQNAITVGYGSVLTNAGRPLIHYWDVPAAAQVIPPELMRGAEGPHARYLQWALNQRGAGLVVDGDFGGKTQAAVAAFQLARNLVCADERTWSELIG